MTPAEARTAVRESTLHDDDTQVTDDMVDDRLDLEYRRLYRHLGRVVPSLVEAESSPTIASGQSTFSKPNDFERLVRLERNISGSNYEPVMVLHPDRLNVNQSATGDVSGTYRLTYTKQPVAGYASYDLPGGVELVLIARVSAWVARRLNDDPKPFLDEAAEVWAEQKRALRDRYGAHPVPGLVRRQSSRYIAFERGATFVVRYR